MHLRNRSGRRRLALEIDKERLQRCLEFIFNGLARNLKREGGEPVAKIAKILHKFFADQVGAHRQGLAELDKTRAEIAKRVGEPLPLAQTLAS